MNQLGRLHFYPEWIIYIGATALAGSVLLGAPFCLMSVPSSVEPISCEQVLKASQPVMFTLGLEEAPSLPIPDLSEELTVSISPARPGATLLKNGAFVRLKKSSSSKRVLLPCRLDLEVQKDRIVFAKGTSPFWVELSEIKGSLVEGKSFISSGEEGKTDSASFSLPLRECPLQTAGEFPEKSPFRVLAEAQWWGCDLLKEHHHNQAGVSRIEMAGDLIDCKEGEWLVWKEGRWQKTEEIQKEAPIARIHSSGMKSLLLEGWDKEEYVRLSINLVPPVLFKIRGEDLFSSIRIRSEKQISCMLEKQCMILRAGDWVLKSNNRWKILRNDTEKQAFLNGKGLGELFIFEQIHQKQGQKMIQGRLFNTGRTQMIPIELAAQTNRKTKEKIAKKGKI